MCRGGMVFEMQVLGCVMEIRRHKNCSGKVCGLNPSPALGGGGMLIEDPPATCSFFPVMHSFFAQFGCIWYLTFKKETSVFQGSDLLYLGCL